MAIAFLIFLCLSALYWLVMLRAGLRSRAVKELAPSGNRSDWPGLSVIVPACNEGAEIEPAARTLLGQDYPGLEIIFVDDRSTDKTGAILDRLAASDDRVRVLHLDHLPEGWLGKVHALHQGLTKARGEFVLFTDADVHLTPGCLRAAVEHMLREGLDHLAGFPQLRPSGLTLGAMIAAFLRQFVAVMRPWKVSDSRSKAFIGVGAFNLVRREMFLSAGGFEWLRMEVADDVGVGLMMKRSRRRCGVASMTEWVSLHWHRTIGQAMRGAEKGWSSVCRFSVAHGLTVGLVTLVLELSPLAGLAAVVLGCGHGGLAGILALVGGFLFAAYFAASLLMAHWMHQGVAAHLLSILTAPVSFVAVARTAILGRRSGGALWRGTLYTTEQLRRGMRLKFP